MGIIWLLIKITLYSILFVLSVITILTCIILISPVNYEIYFSKDEEISYDIKIKYLKCIVATFVLKDSIKKYQVKIMGKTAYLNDTSPKSQDSSKDYGVNQGGNVNKKDSSKYTIEKKHKNNILSKKTQDLNKNHNVNNDQHADVNKQIINDKNKPYNKSEKYSNGKSNDLLDKSRNKNNNKKINFKDAMGGLSGIKDITVCALVFIKDLLIYISPKEYSFEIVLGRDDPADTGELVAKLIMMYPFYYKHGIIRGDYDKEGIRGGCLLEGKIRIGGIINLVIKFLLRTPVRTFLKNILYNKEG